MTKAAAVVTLVCISFASRNDEVLYIWSVTYESGHVN